MLNIANLQKTFYKGTAQENPVIRGIDLELREGSFVTVIGSNGAGKSTFLNLIAGNIIPDGGKVELDGHDITRLPEHKRAGLIGRVFQDPNVGTAGDMELQENLAMASLRGQRRGLAWHLKREELPRYREQLASLGLGLEDRLKTRVHLLSGGQRQALTLLMATLVRPSLLLLDEHTAALDPPTAARVMQLTDQLVTEQNLTTLMVTHNMRQAIDYGDRLLMLHQGSVIYDIEGEAKKKLTVETLLHHFAEAAGDELVSDSMLL